MATYAFETITAQQALAIGPLDTVTFAGTARGVMVAYNIPAAGPPSVTITVGGRSVEFGANVLEVSERGGLDFAGDSRLLIGGTGDDPLMGMAEADALFGGQGDDTVVGQDGDDFMQGNAGADRMFGEYGADTVLGGQGDDMIRTGQGAAGERGDFGHGNMGHDTIYGGWGNDTLLGGQGHDDVRGGDGADYLSGDLGDDVVRGGAGADTVLGGGGNDILFAGGGADSVDGGEGDDVILVSAGYADGGDGADTLFASGGGKCVLLGGIGADRFEVFDPASARYEDVSEIRDWGRSETIAFDLEDVRTSGPGIYQEITAADYASALAAANAIIAGGRIAYVAVQFGVGDVAVFADTDGNAGNGAEAAIILAGRRLTDIDWSNIV